MTLISKIYAEIRRSRIKKNYHNGDITILTPNCLGGGAVPLAWFKIQLSYCGSMDVSKRFL